MFNLAELWGPRADGSNPCRHVRRYKEEPRERFLSSEEFQRLGKVLDEILEEGSETRSAVVAIRLLMLTGCRRSEIQKLRWEHVDLKAAELQLTAGKTGGRTVPLSPSAVRLLASLPREDDNPWVIVGRKRGAHLTDLEYPWRRIRARAGLHDVRIHDLRHSFASRTLALGEGLPMIGKLLGHTHRCKRPHVTLTLPATRWRCRLPGPATASTAIWKLMVKLPSDRRREACAAPRSH